MQQVDDAASYSGAAVLDPLAPVAEGVGRLVVLDGVIRDDLGRTARVLGGLVPFQAAAKGCEAFSASLRCNGSISDLL